MSPVHADIDRLIEDMFQRLAWEDHTNEEIIAAMHQMGYIDLADAYFNWSQED